ncbi:MAG: hypothetical protein Fur007_18850 [Rhodoferax sp.]
MLGLTGGMVVLALLLGLYLQRRVVGRIVRLQQVVQHEPVSAESLPVRGSDEIARLAQVVLGYVHRIQANERELQLVNRNLAYLAEHDPLTRLANRRHFDQATRRLLALVSGPVAIAIVDIDHFKRVNDEHGHVVGDHALVHLASRLNAAMRDQDVLARFGGEEFVMAMPIPSRERALEIAQRLRTSIASQPVALESGAPLHLTISVGLALIVGLPRRLSEAQADALVAKALHQADAALYRAKSEGRDCVRLAPDDIVAADPAPEPVPKESE